MISSYKPKGKIANPETLTSVKPLNSRFVSILQLGLMEHCAKAQLPIVCIGCWCLLFLTDLGQAKPVGSVQIINTNAGRIMTANADQYDNTVYIGGLAYRPSDLGIGAHVHVWGVDKEGNVVFSKTAYIYFTGKPSFVHTASYIVSVSPTVFEKAKTIYVTFHSSADAESRAAEHGE
jgi:hypothetical protein